MADEYEWAIISTPYAETFPVEVNRRRFNELKQKAAALDAILASWGMTWEQYRTQTGTDAPAHGREPNVDSEENRIEAPQGDDPRRA